MGKDFHHLVKQFVVDKILNHNMVESYKDISDNDYYIYILKRRNRMSDIVLLLDDNYHFGEIALADAINRLPNGGIILLPKPESSIVVDNVPFSGQNIYVAKIGLISLHPTNYFLFRL